MTARDRCPGFFSLSQHLADDLPGQERRRIAAHLNDCEQCRALLHQIERDRAAYAELGQEPYDAAWRDAVAQSSAPGTSRRARRRPALFPLRWKVLLPVAAAAVVAALIVPRLMSPPPRRAPYRGYKGDLSLQIVAKRNDRQFVVTDNQRLCPGDALRFSVTASGQKSHLVIFSLDQASELSVFYPNETTPRGFLARSGKTVALTGQGRHVLPGSIILDQSRGREVIFMIAAPRPFDPRPLQDRVRKIFKRDPRAAATLTARTVDFAGTIRALVVVKAPCS